MSMIERIKASNLTVYNGLQNLRPLNTEIRQFGNEITLYPADNGERYLTKGYNLNDAVYSIVSKNAEKAAQVSFYHSKVKRKEQKTLREYNDLSQKEFSSKSLIELRKMHKSMIEETMVDSKMNQLLKRPNRNQAWDEFAELVFGFRENQGEGNLWFSREDVKSEILEMFVIPKPQLWIVGNQSDFYDVLGYKIQIGANTFLVEKENVVMWKYSNPRPVDNTFEHMRGLAPLSAGMVLLQGMNEGDLRIATSNKNAGASGFAFRKDFIKPDEQQMSTMRSAFNATINNTEMANKIAILGGEWGYFNLGQTNRDQQLLEQYPAAFERLCRIFKTPPGIFGSGNATYDNQKQFNRQWIYSKIAPNMYKLRSLLNDPLLESFKLDPATNLVDCDIMNLPELTQDLKELSDAISGVDCLTLDEKREALGYEPLGTPEAQQIYVSGTLTTISDLNLPLGGSLDEQQNLLGG